jgi:hypothetical protein
MIDTPPSDYRIESLHDIMVRLTDRADQAEAGRSAADARVEDLTDALLRMIECADMLVPSPMVHGRLPMAERDCRDAIADARSVVAGKGR